jgi:hypothetical protein
MRQNRPNRRTAPLSALALLLSALAAACAGAAGPPETAPTAASLAGAWSLEVVDEEAPDAPPSAITVTLHEEEGKLAGTARIGPADGRGPEWPLVKPAFDGETLTFGVDNGEEVLEGIMEWQDGAFAGTWRSSAGRGRLTMTRKSA